jgi:hypothetical protein
MRLGHGDALVAASDVLVVAGNPYRRGRLGTVELLVLTSLDHLLLILEKYGNIFTCLQNKATLMRGSIVLSHPFELVFPGCCRAEEALSHQLEKHDNKDRCISWCLDY